MKKFEIVCVDDDKDVLDIIVDTVKDTGFEAKGFQHAPEAVEYVAENKHNIIMILSDLRMDDMDGFEYKRALGKTCKDIPFVIITGFWTAEMSSEAMALGIDAFLEKPIKADVLNEQIENFAKVRKELLEEEREMVEGFLEESSPMLDEIESLILELEESADKEQPLSVYFRLLHTIKGTASCVGLTNLGNYTHKYEDFIGELRNNKIPVNTQSINVLLSGLDDLKVFFKAVEEASNDAELQWEDKTDKFTNLENIAANTDAAAAGSAEKKEVAATDDKKSSKAEEDKMTVSMGLLNEFMEESGELTVIRNSILKTVKKIEGRYRGDNDIDQLNQLLTGMYSVTSNIQGKITEMRKVPLKNTFRPYKRLVRDLTKKLGKEVDFIIEGEELLVDNVLAKLFSNTMIHIIRNSLDHGIETSEMRQAKGKDSLGKLEIRASEVGEDIVLNVIDDGKGIDPEIIKKLAIQKGLYTAEEIESLSELQIINIIFESGFSTAEQVSDLSGRGVGMDMVRGSFLEMGGEVYVQSKKDIGSTFTLKVPVPKSVLIINTLSVSCADRVTLFHMDEVVEVLRYEQNNRTTQIYEMNDKKILEHNQEMIELVYLHHVFKVDQNIENEDILNIVILRVSGKKLGVIVDEIYEFEEVVLRKITDQIESHNLFHGASLVGAGEVAMILSAEGIAYEVGIETEEETESFIESLEKLQAMEQGDEYMLFKYSDEDQLCVNLEYVERFEKVKTKNIERVGDNYIIRYNNANLVLVDPGYALHLKDESMFNHDLFASQQTIDVIVVNTGGKKVGLCVQELGEIKYTSELPNTETIDMEGLLGSLFIDEKTVCIVDVNFIGDTSKQRKKLQESLSFQIPDAA